MYNKSLSAVVTFLLLCFLTACGAAGTESSLFSEPASSISPESSSGESPDSEPEQTESSKSSHEQETSASEPQESSGTFESEPSSYPVVDWEHFTKPDYPGTLDFPQDDPSKDMSYEEYFSTERYLNSYALQTSEYGAEEGMRGYLYVKGDSNSPPCWNWDVPEDNLYLFCRETGERVLLAEIKNLRYIRIFIDRLYLITETEVWRCGRLGENLTLVYEHPEKITIFVFTSMSADVLFFLTFGEDAQCLWRLYLPGGQTEKVCNLLDLPQSADGISIIPVSNMAVLVSGEWEGKPRQPYIYSMRTGKLTPFEYDGVNNFSSCFDAWVRKYYPLNQY